MNPIFENPGFLLPAIIGILGLGILVWGVIIVIARWKVEELGFQKMFQLGKCAAGVAMLIASVAAMSMAKNDAADDVAYAAVRTEILSMDMPEAAKSYYLGRIDARTGIFSDRLSTAEAKGLLAEAKNRFPHPAVARE